MKIGLILPASMIISGETSGVVRQAIIINALLNRVHDCKFIDHINGIFNYDFLMIFQHSPEINHLIERVRLKQIYKNYFMPIYDPDSLPDLRKKFVYRLPTEKLNYFSSPRIMRLGCDKSESVWVRSKWEKNAILATGTKTPIEIVSLAILITINRKLIKVKKDINFIFVGHIDDPRKILKD